MTDITLPPFKEARDEIFKERMGPALYPLFEKFLARVLKHLGFPKPTRTQIDIARYLQFGPQQGIIQAFRGVGKSFVTSAFVIWLLMKDPDYKIMVVSASKTRSDSFSHFVKKLINEIPECQYLKAGPGQRDSNVMFDVGPCAASDSPSVKSVGITGQITGSRADFIIGDDVEVPKNSFTAIMRERTGELVKEFDSIIKPLPHTRIIYLGTPQTEMSLYNTLNQERGYSLRVWPAEIPKNPGVYRGNLAPFVQDMIDRGLRPGVAVDPERFDGEYLRKKQFSLGRSTYTLQFMLDTTLADSDQYPLKLEDLMVMGLDPKQGPVGMAYGKDPRYAINDLQPVGFNGDYYYQPMFISKDFASWQGTVMAIDPSGRGKDETAYAVVRQLHGRLFLVASGGLHGGSTPENLQELADIAKRYQANAIVLEVNFGDGMFGQLLKPYLTRTHPCSIEETRAVGQKERRIINTLEPIIQQHRLVVDRRVIESDLHVEPRHSLFYQMTRLSALPKCLQHDDRLDALEMAVAYWISQMEVDETNAAEDHRQELLDQDLEDFINGGPLMLQGVTQQVWGHQQDRGGDGLLGRFNL
ncbi:phage terminase large subunit [Phyllobacterium endophyticum]|uniref:phage terminase large subunit n=1 Tax=Phyllobacterium endophyticum TaxID=1149773 RepID=UPI001AEE6EF9|nr:phage terminase large subunit [Phyllobacterium endophyticum]